LQHRIIHIVLLFLLMAGVQNARATLLFYDGFDYPEGEELGEYSSSTIWGNDKNPFTIVSGSLHYQGLEASRGNRVNAAATFPDRDSVRTQDGGWPRQSSGCLYVSFILRLHSVAEIRSAGHGTPLITLSDTSRNSELLGINLLNDGAMRMGVLKHPGSSASVSASAFFTSGPGANLLADGSATYLVVAKYEWIPGASNDVVTLWVNPASLGAHEPAGNRISAGTGGDGGGSAGRLTLCRGPNVNIDEVRIGQTWAEVTPTIKPSRNWLAIVVVLVCGLVMAGFWITLLRRKVRERTEALVARIQEHQKSEHQRMMEQERARIARDLHDELGADITEIGMLATRIQGDAAGSEETRRCLQQVADKSRQMVATLEEIVWAMNPQHDSLAALVSYFSFFADRFLGLASIKLRIDVSENAAGTAVESHVRHQLFLVFKEAMANLVRHSGASEARLAFRVENRELRVEVADNGRGFREPDPASGSHEGIANMRKRMEKIGGRFEIAGETGGGTTVKLSVPLNT
jgi:signal transduction histidine kinase